jgi:hypothetical protein
MTPPIFASERRLAHPKSKADEVPSAEPHSEQTTAGAPAGLPLYLQGTPVLRLAATVYLDPDPLAPYTVLREANPDAWAALDKAARRRTLNPSVGADTDTAGPAVTQFDIPLSRLVRPPVQPASAAGDLRSRLWPVVSTPTVNPDEAASVIRDHILSEWAAQNTELLTRDVTVRLKDPSEVPLPLGSESEQVLEFTVAGKTMIELGEIMESQDGSLTPVELDFMGSNNLETIVAAVSAQAMVIASAGDLLQTSTVLLDSETRFWEDANARPDSVSMKALRQHAALFSFQLADAKLEQGARAPFDWTVIAFVQQHPEFAQELGPLADRLSELDSKIPAIAASAEERFKANAEFLRTDPGVPTLQEIEEVRSRGGVVDYMGYGLMRAVRGAMNTFSGGYFDARDEAREAYTSGEMSWDQMQSLVDAAAGRGAIVGIVTVAITAATAGLGAELVPALTSTVGRSVLYAGAENAIGTMAAMETSTIVTHGTQFTDPTQQRIWSEGAYTPGQIAMGGLVAFGQGAAFAGGSIAVGKFVSWARTRPRLGGIDTAPGPSGWVAQQTPSGGVQYVHPDVPGEIIETEAGLELHLNAPDGSTLTTEIAFEGAQAPVAPSRPGVLPADVADEFMGALEGSENPFSLDMGSRRAAAIDAGERDFILDRAITFDVDEPLAVGQTGIKRQRAVDRALDPHNRQLLDPNTNRITKHTRVSPEDIARGRVHLDAVSLDQDPAALFTRRFDEVTELQQVFEEATARVRNPQRLRPTALKNEINANIRDIIQNGRTPAGIEVRDTLRALGYEFVPGRGLTAVR